MPAVVTVHVDASGDIGTVPPKIFGTFIEPIEYSIDNGVVAEILVNSSLEARLWNHATMEEIYRDQPDMVDSSDGTGIPFPWGPLNPAAGNRYELHAGDVANSWQSLEIIGVPNPLTGIAERVYLPVPRTFNYNASFYAMHVSGPTKVTVSLRELDSGNVVATADAMQPLQTGPNTP
jgi:alpha-L-arabinofuranosidase